MNTRADDPIEGEVEHSSDEGALALMSGAELDRAQRYAEKHPRKVSSFKREALELATSDAETADECIYALPRAGKTIEGPSVRFAEILVYAWRNVDAGTRPIAEGRDTVTTQGVFRDLERNNRLTREVTRRITDRNGKRYNADMIGTTTNAAASIALRNAIFNGIPRALWWGIYLEVRKVVAGDSKTFNNKRAETMQALQKVGVSEAMVLAKYGHKGLDDITTDNVVELRGLRNMIRDGEISPEEAFKPLADDSTDANANTSRAEAAAAALRKKQEGQPQPGTDKPAETKPPAQQTDPAAGQGQPTQGATSGVTPDTAAGSSAKTAPAKNGHGKKAAAKGGTAELPFYSNESAIAAIRATTTVTACENLYDEIFKDLAPRNEGTLPEDVQGAYSDWHAHLVDQV